MSGISGVFNSDRWRGPRDDRLLPHMLAQMTARGNGPSAVWHEEPCASLGVVRHPWEQAAEFSGDALVERDGGGLALVADASLYYRDDLRDALDAREARLLGETPSHLILAAYRTWGPNCVQYLEGDYAFVVWDRDARQVFCARDFSGSRPLFYAQIGDTLIVASTMAALQAHPDCLDSFNAPFLAETALNLWVPADETAYTGVRALPAGCGLLWTAGEGVRVTRQWQPTIDSRTAPPFEETAQELRSRLIRAVDERLSPTDVTSVWMSGGRDSPAVFACGQVALRREPATRRLHAVSVSYPPGDSGREDELITAIASHWDAPIHWLDIGAIPFWDGPEAGAARRDEPYEMPYQSCNRALARGSLDVEARVALDGWGGDQLFQMTTIHLADLFRRGRWLALAREWRALQVRDSRFLFRMAVTPVLPPLLLAAAKALRGGRPLPNPMAASIPTWVRPEWASRLSERQQLNMPRRNGRESFADCELSLFLTSPTVTRARARLSAIGLEAGVEVRSPLYDPRIIALAVQRPPAERRSGRDTKLLLRAALRDLLPRDVLAPRRNRTGVTDDYLTTAMRATYPRLLRDVLEMPVVLADLGIVEPAIWRRTAEHCLSRAWDIDVAMALWFTLQTELWLRAKARHGVSDDGRLLAVLPPGERPGFPYTMEVNGV